MVPPTNTDVPSLRLLTHKQHTKTFNSLELVLPYILQTKCTARHLPKKLRSPFDQHLHKDVRKYKFTLQKHHTSKGILKQVFGTSNVR